MDRNKKQGPKSEEDNEYNILEPKAEFVLSERENKLREHKYKTGNLRVQYTKIHCTSCNSHLGSALVNFHKIFVHPLLKVLICKECYDFYKSGGFQQEEDGSETFCRWCGQGGKVVCCTSCPMVFCVQCIKLNFSYSKYAEIRNNDSWKCFSCLPPQLIDLKIHCYEFREYALAQMGANSNKDVTKPESEFDGYLKRLDFTTCCSNKSKKRKILLSHDEIHGKIFNVKVANQEEPSKPLKFIKLNASDITKCQDQKQTTKFVPSDAKKPQILVDNKIEGKTGMKVTVVGMPISAGAITNKKTNQAGQHGPTPLLPKFLIPNLPVATAAATTCLPPFNSQNPPLLYLRPIQPRFSNPMPVVHHRHDQSHFAAKERHLEKSICATALANSTFASTIFNLTQMEMGLKNPTDYVPFYNALQESVTTAIVSLMQIQKELNLFSNITGASTNKTFFKQNHYY